MIKADSLARMAKKILGNWLFTFSSLAHRLNSRSATAKARRADKVKMINLVEIELVISILFYSIK